MDTDSLRQEVEKVYQTADQAVTRFAKASGLKCPVTCGRCCESPLIEASPLECLPLAYSLLPKAEDWLALLKLRLKQEKKTLSSCPFYVCLGAGNGFCSVYENRPLICRLFGFAAYIDRQGQEQLDSCHLHTDEGTVLPAPDPDGTGKAKAPLYRDYKRQLRRISDALSEPGPVAESVYEALRYISK